MIDVLLIVVFSYFVGVFMGFLLGRHWKDKEFGK